MPFISLTRLRVRSYRYLPQFAWQAFKSGRQAERASGFLGGKVLREAKNTFWTITAWEDESSMRAYRNAGAHGRVMPRLLDWCDEASLAHWHQESADLPDWRQAHQRIVKEGRLSKVRNPSPDQVANHIVLPRPGRLERILRPARNDR